MEDLLQSQIGDSCKLALPEGLRDLMCDISREVLRARPQNLYQFIADYLAAMLVARETLTIAGHINKDVCECSCEPELDDELRNIGLSQQEAEEAKNIIIQYLESDKVKEESMLVKLLKTNIDKQKLPDIHNAVKAAYKRNLIHRKAFFHGSSSDEDDATRAAKDTLDLYWKSGSPERKHNPVPSEEQTPFYHQQERDHHTAEASSTDSSGCMFNNIIYDGGIQDLYISNNCKPYKNSSLTSLAGSYGTPLITREQTGTTIPEEHLVRSGKEENYPGFSSNRSEKRQVHIDLSDTEETEIDEDIFKEDRIKELDREEQKELDIIEEVAISDNNSDLSIPEVIDED